MPRSRDEEKLLLLREACEDGHTKPVIACRRRRVESPRRVGSRRVAEDPERARRVAGGGQRRAGDQERDRFPRADRGDDCATGQGWGQAGSQLGGGADHGGGP